MGKREKLIARLTNSLQNATFSDIRNLLEYEGFYLDRGLSWVYGDKVGLLELA